MAKKSKLEKKLHQYPRWARVVIGLIATTLILGVPMAIIGVISGELTKVMKITGGVIGIIYGVKTMEYLVTEGLKAVL